MTRIDILKKLKGPHPENLDFLYIEISQNEKIKVYPSSINRLENVVFFIGKVGNEKSLYAFDETGKSDLVQHFQNEKSISSEGLTEATLSQFPLNHENASALQSLFAFTRPVLIGIDDSIGLGDRLGLANPGHVRAIRGSHMKPVLAQQSIRELARTEREPEEVMDTAIWAVFQEGYKDGFGADADHLKTTDDIDRLVNAGFTMFTFDPGDHVVNEADELSLATLEDRAREVQFAFLNGDFEALVKRYAGQDIQLTKTFKLKPDRVAVLRALVKYGGVIEHTSKMYRHLKRQHPGHAAEVELSVDETDAVTTPFEHFFVASELKRQDVELVSLAPRFVGQFEKGIDYIGDLEYFKEEYLKHLAIAERLGPYKISIHSGSDKFDVYAAIGSLRTGHVHVKTAGTSYLEALKTIAATEPDLFREILDFSRARFEVEKRTYHVSAKTENVPAASECSDTQLLALFEQNDARQVLHVTFGKVLTTRGEGGSYLFRDRILACLQEHEELHYHNLEHHLGKHVRPFAAAK